MAPFHKATILKLSRLSDDREIYAGDIDAQWVVGA
jgi:hypothetical protein